MFSTAAFLKTSMGMKLITRQKNVGPCLAQQSCYSNGEKRKPSAATVYSGAILYCQDKLNLRQSVLFCTWVLLSCDRRSQSMFSPLYVT